jgi:hypothetical protein
MAHAGVTIALRSSGVNSKAGTADHGEIRDRFRVARSKDTRVDFNEPCGLPGPPLLNSPLHASSLPEEWGSCATAIFSSPFFPEHGTAN